MDIEKLLNKLTLEQKLAQMTQFVLNLMMDAADGDLTGPESVFNIDKENWKYAGSVIGVAHAKDMIDLQTKHMAEDENKIPILFMRDVIHGFKTIYPVPLGMGATWDPELMRECCRMAAKESSVSGIHVTFSPMLDLVRDARWGRVVESTGEDPYLNSLFARAMVEGYQGDLTDKYNIAACVKHFAAYGAAESGRDYNTVDMCEHTLREYYLPAYHAAIEAGVEMVMTSFNVLGGIPSSGNKWLYEELLRKEWGFDKVVISDWNAFCEMIEHGFCENMEECAEKAINAGVDIEMMSVCYITGMKKLIKEGKVTEDQIDTAVRRILKLKDKLGLFENPYRSASEEEEKKYHLCAEHRELARRAARESLVLLKNDSVLPLDENSESVAVIGPFAETGSIGSWAASGKANEAVSVLTGVKNLYNGKVTYAKGCDGELNVEIDESMMNEAAECAKEAKSVILCVGETSRVSGEGKSRADITIPKAQRELIRCVTKANKNTAVVLFSGRPLALKDIIDDIPALAVAWHPGTEGGNAIAELLFGKANFEGRLTMSFPIEVGQCPIYYNQMRTGRPKLDDSYMDGFLSMYIDCPNAPMYPFGYGLSYTEFEYGNVVLSSKKMCRGEKITASVKIKNTGKRKGMAVPQLYLRDVTASLVRPVKELKAFEKVEIEPNEEKTVSFEIDENMLAFHTASGKFEAENGRFLVYIASDSSKGEAEEFILE